MAKRFLLRRLSAAAAGLLLPGIPARAKADDGKTGVTKPDAKPAGDTSVAHAAPTSPGGAAETGAANATETAAKPTTETAPPAVAAAKKPLIHNLLTLGADLYMGATNVTGPRARSNDGVWGGYGTAYPSLFAVNWKSDETHGLHVSVGVGDMYTGTGTTWRQPVEAYFQAPTRGGGTLTVGKFYVPFATQEWEYEPKYGMMLQTAHGAMNYTASLNYNFNRDTPNAYLRVGRQLSPRTSLGISAGGGRGVFTDSSHGLALGLDLTHNFGGMQFSSEYNFANGPNGAFQFLYGKLTFTHVGNFQPSIGAYYWHDGAQELGQYHSVLFGLGYKLTEHLTLESGYARGNDRNIVWFQSHVTF